MRLKEKSSDERSFCDEKLAVEQGIELKAMTSVQEHFH